MAWREEITGESKRTNGRMDGTRVTHAVFMPLSGQFLPLPLSFPSHNWMISQALTYLLRQDWLGISAYLLANTTFLKPNLTADCQASW